jgi:predicted transcriptional regulator
MSTDGEVRPTRVQQKCNISYDKFSKYLDELAKRKLVASSPSLCVTDKGKKLLYDYGKINDFILKMRLEYLSGEEHYE